MKTIWWTNTKVAFLCNAAITRARQRQTGTSLLAQTPHWLCMLGIPPFQATLVRRYSKSILFLIPILYKAVKCSTLNCIPNPVHYPSSPAVTQSNSGIRKTSSTGMWPKFVFPANTLQYHFLKYSCRQLWGFDGNDTSRRLLSLTGPTSQKST